MQQQEIHLQVQEKVVKDLFLIQDLQVKEKFELKLN